MSDIRLISKNKKAFHDYSVLESFEAGIELVGSEVKSLRLNHCNLRDSYVMIKKDSAFLIGTHIRTYDKSCAFSPEPIRERRLLLHKEEIRKIRKAVEQKGYTIIPLKIYFKQALVKVEIGLCKGKKLYDKRDTIKQRDVKRDIDRQMKYNK